MALALMTPNTDIFFRPFDLFLKGDDKDFSTSCRSVDDGDDKILIGFIAGLVKGDSLIGERDRLLLCRGENFPAIF